MDRKAHLAQCVFVALQVILCIAFGIEVFGELNVTVIRILSILFAATLLGNLVCALLRLSAQKSHGC